MNMVEERNKKCENMYNLAIQYDLFESNDDITLLRKEVAMLREEIATLRRSQFARLNSMGKLFLDQEGQEKMKKKKEKK